MKTNPSKGLSYALEGISLIKRPELRAFVIAPIAVSILVYAVLGYLWLDNVDAITQYIMSYLPEWEWLLWLVEAVLTISIILIFAFTFTLLTNIIASPFLGLLAEKTELYLTGQAIDSGDGWGATLKSIHTSLIREIRKLLYYLPRLIAIFIITLIPGVNIAAPVLWFLFGAWMMSVQYLDYPIDNNQLSFDDLKQHLASHRAATLVYGAIITLFMMIPIVSIVIIPAAVAGATAFWVKEKH